MLYKTLWQGLTNKLIWFIVKVLKEVLKKHLITKPQRGGVK